MSAKRRLRFSRHALSQFEQALAYIAEHDPAAALRLWERIIERLNGLNDVPGKGRVVPELGDPARREIVVPPFRIVYRTTSEEIRIVAVVHGRRVLEHALDDDEESSG